MSSETELLAALGRAGRAPEILDDPRWEALAAGTLPDAEREALVAAARDAGLTDEEIAAFGPRDASFDDKLADLVGAVAGKGAGDADETDVGKGGGGANTLPLAPPVPPAARAPTRPTKKTRPAWMAPAGFVIAAAAGAALLLRSPGDAPWPVYTLSVEGGAAPVRNAPAGDVPVIVPDATMTLVARPERSVVGAAEARAFVSASGDGAASGGAASGGGKRWDVPIEVADGGAARITGRAGELLAGVPAGVVRVCLAVGSRAVVSGMVTEPPAPGEHARYGLACSSLRWQPEGARP